VVARPAGEVMVELRLPGKKGFQVIRSFHKTVTFTFHQKDRNFLAI
jgi:hypothetical protein